MLVSFARARCQLLLRTPVLHPGISSSHLLARPHASGAAALSSNARSAAANVPSAVYLEDVPEGTTVDALRNVLPFTVMSLSATTDPTSFRAVLNSAAAARRAIESNNASRLTIGGRAVFMKHAEKNRPFGILYVTNFPSSTTRERMAAVLGVPLDAVSESCQGRRGMYMLVDLGSVKRAKAILDNALVTPVVLDGEQLVVSYGHAGHARKQRDPATAKPSCWVGVSGFPRSATREQLADALGVSVGAIAPVYVGTQGPYTCATFDSPLTAREAMRRYVAAPPSVGDAVLALRYVTHAPLLPNSRLWFSGVNGDEQLVRELLAPYDGTFIRIDRLIGRSTEFIVTFHDVPAAATVLEALGGTALPDDVLHIRYAPTHNQKKYDEGTDGGSGTRAEGPAAIPAEPSNVDLESMTVQPLETGVGLHDIAAEPSAAATPGPPNPFRDLALAGLGAGSRAMKQ